MVVYLWAANMNAVIKPESLKTLFNHGVTDAELEELLGSVETYEEYIIGLSQDSAYGHLYFLYDLRGDDATAKAFLNKIQDARYRNNLSLSSCILNN